MGVILSPDQWVEAHLGPIAEALSSFVFYTVPIAGTDVPLIVMWTAVAGLFFTFYLRFINVRALGLAIRHARGDFEDADARGEISHFKAVATAVWRWQFPSVVQARPFGCLSPGFFRCRPSWWSARWA